MKTTTVYRYECGVCHAAYGTAQDALDCEKKPVTRDRGVKVGDIVLITVGDGTGHRAKVQRIGVLSREWGHYAWEHYWHTVYLDAEVIDSWGNRMLTFDQYAVEKS